MSASILDQVLGPSELQAVFNVTPKLWNNITFRGVADMKILEGAKSKFHMDVIQAVQLGIQLDLHRQVGMDFRDSLAIAREAGSEIEKLFLNPHLLSGPILYAFTVGPSSPKWKRITLDTAVADIEDSFGGQRWLVLDVGFHVLQVKRALEERDPGFAKYMRQREAELRAQQN